MGFIQIHDYSKSNVISLNIGEGKIIQGNFKIIHPINLSFYEKDLIYTHIIFLVNKTKNYITNLKYKTRIIRSLDWIGTGWKWVAGTPDHHDMQIVENHVNEVLTNNNLQVVINQDMANKINEVVQKQNDIIKKGSKSDNQQNADIYFKVQHIEQELRDIIYAIHWSKTDTINPQLLSQEEKQNILEKIKFNNFPYSSIEEALNFASIKIAAKKKPS